MKAAPAAVAVAGSSRDGRGHVVGQWQWVPVERESERVRVRLEPVAHEHVQQVPQGVLSTSAVCTARVVACVEPRADAGVLSSLLCPVPTCEPALCPLSLSLTHSFQFQLLGALFGV